MRQLIPFLLAAGLSGCVVVSTSTPSQPPAYQPPPSSRPPTTYQPPPASGASRYVMHARPGRNSLSGRYPIRGFGDSNQVDVWVPFYFSGGQLGAISQATITMVIKPIGQLTGTDGLGLKGASGKVHWVKVNFAGLRARQWNSVNVDITRNTDVLNAIRRGHLEGVIQDDSAVQSVTLVVHGGRSAVRIYAYDVYYGYGPQKVRASTTTDEGAAKRWVQQLQRRGYRNAHYVKRFDKMGTQ